MSRLCAQYLDHRRQEALTILDIGSQDINGVYRPIFENPVWNYQGVDRVPGKNVDIILQSRYRWNEIDSNSADVTISGQALEHIEFFWITMLEIGRVLKPGGLGCVIAPSAGPEHRYPYDCWRFYPDGLVAMTKFAGLIVIEANT